jgi:hypothetical protein
MRNRTGGSISSHSQSDGRSRLPGLAFAPAWIYVGIVHLQLHRGGPFQKQLYRLLPKQHCDVLRRVLWIKIGIRQRNPSCWIVPQVGQARLQIRAHCRTRILFKHCELTSGQVSLRLRRIPYFHVKKKFYCGFSKYGFATFFSSLQPSYNAETACRWHKGLRNL